MDQYRRMDTYVGLILEVEDFGVSLISEELEGVCTIAGEVILHQLVRLGAVLKASILSCQQQSLVWTLHVKSQSRHHTPHQTCSSPRGGSQTWIVTHESYDSKREGIDWPLRASGYLVTKVCECDRQCDFDSHLRFECHEWI